MLQQDTSADSSGQSVDCLILGAGASGLAAAAKLCTAGLSVLVLEARDRIGGRVHSVPVGAVQQVAPSQAASSQDLCIDLGASWIHGTVSNPVAALAAQHGISTLPTDVVATTLHASNGQLVPAATSQEYEEVYQLFCRDIAVLQQDPNCQVTGAHLSVADVRQQFIASTQLTAAQQQGCDFLINRWIEQEYGAEATMLSALYFDADEPHEGDDVLFPGGYHQVLESLTNCLKPGCILLQHEVQHIQYTDRAAVVRAQTQQGLVKYLSRYVIVTFPLGVLKKCISHGTSTGNLDNSSSSSNPQGSNSMTGSRSIDGHNHAVTGDKLCIAGTKSSSDSSSIDSSGNCNGSTSMFDPPLPIAKVLAISKLGIGLLNKVVLVYDKPFWAATPWLNRLPGAPYNGRWMEMFNLGLFVPQLPALVAFNAAGAAWSAEQDSDEELTRQVTNVLGLMYPEAASAAACPKQVFITRWGCDPWALGSYACMAVGSSLEDLKVLAEPVNDVLYFAGEAMSLSNQGTVHGAYKTGVAAAQAILTAEQRR